MGLAQNVPPHPYFEGTVCKPARVCVCVRVSSIKTPELQFTSHGGQRERKLASIKDGN